MDVFPSGVEEWSPQLTNNPLAKRKACSDTFLTPIDCGNGVCCPRGSVCEAPAANGVVNCRGTLSGLPGGTAVVPGFTVTTCKSSSLSLSEVPKRKDEKESGDEISLT